MRKQIAAALLSCSLIVPQICTVHATTEEEDFSNLQVKYSQPAAVKNSSGGWTFGGTPIGNGKIGAKIYGGVDKDVYQLNDASFWSGGPQYTDICDETGARREALENTRELLQGDLTDWDNISAIESSAKQMVGSSLAASYMPVGDLILDFGGDESYSDYSRILDLDSATVTTKYKKDGVSYTRTAFASYPDNVIAIKLDADGGTIDMTASLSFPEEKEAGAGSEYRGVTQNDEYVMSWRAPVSADKMIWSDDYGMTVEARVKITETDGSVSCSDDGISLTGATEAVILYSSETSYNGFDKNPTIGSGEEKDPSPLLDGYMSNAEQLGYDELYSRHLEDYRGLFRRVWVNVEGDDAHVLAYQYKRYELISCSRSGEFFRMGYGMWNPQMQPTSWGNHYMNENVQKENILLESANLAELQAPAIKWLENLAENGSKTAEYDFGFRGWMAPHHSDIWSVTSLQGDGSKRTEWAIFPVGGMWTNLIVWEHYLYSMDKDFLRDTAYPLIEGATAFACDWLVEREFTADEISGEPGTYLVTSPSTSAENSYGLNYGEDYKSGLFEAVSVGTAQDMTIVRETFEQYMETCDILGIDNDLLAEVKDKYDRLLPYQIHYDGELQEWAIEEMKPNKERDIYSTHRHASQLLGLWPYDSITQDNTELFDAAYTALENRGSGARMPDKAAMWVRLGEPDKALELMKTTNDSMIAQWGADVQNAFAEFIVQSHRGYIDLLPALPSSWQNGEIKGTRVRGGYELDIKWSGSELESCVIYSTAGGGFPDIRLDGEKLDESDPRITFVDAQAPEQEAENITANAGTINVEDDTAYMDYSVSSQDQNSATRVSAALAVYDMSSGEPVLCDMVYKNVKLYNTQSYSGTLRYDCSGYVGNGKEYMFKGFVWRASDMQPLCAATVSDNYEFEVKKIYNSAADFNGEQGPVWYFRSEDGNLNFSELESCDSAGGYWQGAYTYLRVGGSFMHPQTLNAVRTFKAPADGTIIIKSSTIKADDSKGTADGVFIKIVKETSSGTEQLYPSQEGYAQINNAQHLSGFSVPEIMTEVSAGDTINFILNQGDGNAHDGTRWTNEIEYVAE